MHLASVHTRSRRGIVPIIAPRGMVEVNYKIDRASIAGQCPERAEENAGVLLTAQDAAQWRCNLASRQRSGGDLIEQWLKQVIVVRSISVTSTGADFSACAADRPPNPPPTMMTLGRRLIDRPLVLNGFLVSVHWIPGMWSAQSLCRSSDAGVR